MTFSRSFLRVTAICSFLSVATTLALIFLPRLYGPVDSFDKRIALVENPFYTLRAWVYLLHPFVVLPAALGIAVVLRRVASGAIAVGFLGFLLWAFTEAAQQVLTLVVFGRWARAFLSADAAAQDVLRTQIATYDAVWDAMFLLLLIGFLIGNVLYGIAMIKRARFDRVLGMFFLAIAFLTAASISSELGGPSLPAAFSMWLYPIVQPLARFLIGLWLLRAQDSRADVTSSSQNHR
ncbi:MAG: hypothetical protein ACKVU1_16920 [bacterium]